MRKIIFGIIAVVFAAAHLSGLASLTDRNTVDYEEVLVAGGGAACGDGPCVTSSKKDA